MALPGLSCCLMLNAVGFGIFIKYINIAFLRNLLKMLDAIAL
ncbi:hypothetical protein QUA79_33860 [Microcoleus sp. F8-D1]